MHRPIEDARIARIWRGRVAAERADTYHADLLEAGIPPIERTALAVRVLRDDRAGESEFLTISYWPDVESMARFAGAGAHALP